ncbi:ParB N-terminal domain-containing protein [Streptomyces sp. NBC_01622]|uniref:ParB/RepB/Spo0J family partition protein n=1 Tax=Streptomyces sp. NBC_01622 TaxID=2975903 RepID=UPI00386A7642|nr:ParB N-terminal domain-containing protein [Streptomyces sp. NBC_01622]
MDVSNDRVLGDQTGLTVESGDRTMVCSVSITSLHVGDSLRQNGVDNNHARLLAESEGKLPPILVHRPTMRVIDGVHRLLAAELMGRETITVRFFDGNEDEAFVQAVQANVGHGLPLTLADRTTAATRIVRTHPDWSDRRVAGLAGLSPKTVGAIRTRSTEEIPQSTVRVGRDGRVRHLPRRKASPGIPDVPEESASAGDGSPVAVTRRGLPVVPFSRPAPRTAELALRSGPAAVPCRGGTADRMARYQALCHDPSFRLTETGRFLLRLLELHIVRVEEWDRLIANVPPHQADSVADLARECAKAWLDFAERAAHSGVRV